MLKNISKIILITSIFYISCSQQCDRNSKYQNSCFHIFAVKGNWREMGRQYGDLKKDELKKFYNEITTDLITRGMGPIKQYEEAHKTYKYYSDNLKELLKGMSETSGLSLNQHIILDASIYLLTEAVLGGEPPKACSALALWKNKTKDGSLIVGRNWDIDRSALYKYNKYLSVAVFNPLSGNSFANIRYLGQVYAETIFNDKGLFIELNNGEGSDSNYFPERRFTGDLLVEVANKSNSIKEAQKILSDEPAETAYIIQAADSNIAVSFERSTFDMRSRTETDSNYLVAYNSFVDPLPDNWKTKTLAPPSDFQDPRRKNLLKLADSRFKITLEDLKDLMDLEVWEGGAVHDGTVFQVIAKPGEKTIYLRAYEYSDWEKINLNDFFNSPSEE